MAVDHLTLGLVLQALPDTIPVESLLVPLATALGLAVIVERAVELGKNVVDLIPTATEGRAIRKPADLERPLDELVRRHAADRDRRRVERSERDRPGDVEKLRRIEGQLRDGDLKPDQRATLVVTADTMRRNLRAVEGETEPEEALPVSLILVEPATDPDDGATLRAFLIHAVAMVAGIIAARVSGLHLFSALTGTSVPDGLDYLLTGLLIGGGSAPIHMLIRFVTARKVAAPPVTEEPKRTPEAENRPPTSAPAAARTERATTVPPASAAPADDWIEIGYDGGVDRDVLESVHRRRGNPELIVYHHTAMPGDSSF
nr:hypothetical protein [Gemmatimonadota bacterium]NIQ58801.1 hypothetical protein [Gemmatimonadota bacterium]NIU78970.1 hypothetical protein [Gammaproteobacteria bacterium]NIX47721.1 hypothetical protein [Gemmatimonadota bacterium]NIY12091.1 hypothetical protein [Gemmatimonadota bacterium]